MNRKFISAITATAIMSMSIVQCGITVSAEQAQQIYSCDFSDKNDISAYVLYDSTNTEGGVFYDESNGRMGASFGDSFSWNDKNGIKTNITECVDEYTDGVTIGVSLDFTSTYWNIEDIAKATVFMEVVNGDDEKKYVFCNGPESAAANDETVSLSGTVDSYTYKSGDEVYLCVTQPSGVHYYDNIALSAEKAESSSEWIIDDDFSDGYTAVYSTYDSTNTAADIQFYDGLMAIGMGNDWNDVNGIKREITTLVKSGAEYEASADINAYWGETGEIAGKLFFETVSTTGETVQIQIAENSNAAAGSSDGTVTLSGSAKLTFNDGDKVYICITQPSGYHKYDNIKLRAKEQKQEPTITPEDGSLFSDDFSDEVPTGYSVYDSTNTKAELSYNDCLAIDFADSDWSEKNGFRKDITDLVSKTGSAKYSAAADVYSSWWGGVKASLFFEVVSENNTVKTMIAEGVFEGDAGTLSLSGTADLWFDEGDKVYLCATQAAGYQSYDNISMKYIGKADEKPSEEPSEEPSEKPSENPVPTLEPAENALFTDKFDETADAKPYTIYNSSNNSASIIAENGELVAAMGGADPWNWNATNGVRRDITEVVTQYISGVSFGVQLEMTAYWGEENDVSGNVFFETVSNDGTATTTQIGTILPENGSDKAIFKSSSQLNYRQGDKIYLCITQMSGNHRFDNVSMWLENPNDSGIIPLTSGRKYAGVYFPEQSDAVFKNTFSANAETEISAYKPYNEVAYKTAESRDGGAFFEFPEGGNAVRGVRIDITDKIDERIPNGGDVRVTCRMLPWWWWGSASVKIKSGETITNAETYTAKNGDPMNTWVTIGDVVALEHKPGETVEILITMDSSSATGITIDDVCVELPYDNVAVRDIAVSDVSKLKSVDKVSIVYGGDYMTETAVTWENGSDGDSVVYGTTELDGVKARAVITDSAVKVRVSQSGITAEKAELEYGKAVKAQGGNELVFLLDSLEKMNLISEPSGTGNYAEPVSKKTETTAKMAVKDNGNGITIEGCLPDMEENDVIILIKSSDGKPSAAVYTHIAADGGYKAEIAELETGAYTAVMTDTGVKAEFSYATAGEYEEFRKKINGGVSAETLLSEESNRIILGANTYSQLDRLPEGKQSEIYTEFSSLLGNKTRAEAIELFDSLVAVRAADDEISEDEWTKLLEESSGELGIKGSKIFEQYKAMPQEQRKAVKAIMASADVKAREDFAEIFAGAVLNIRLLNAGQYTNIQSILKENAELFEETDVDAGTVSVAAAKYINSHITTAHTTIGAIAELIEEANKNAESSHSNGGGGGGGGGSSAGSSSGITGTNVGLSAPEVSKPSSAQNDTEKEIFFDLAGYEWAKEAIYTLADGGIVNGYDDGSFVPNGAITREAFVKLIVSSFGIPMSGADAEFDDVAADRWSHDYIAAAAAVGIVTGISDTEFAPEKEITRQDAAVMIYRALKYNGVAVSGGELSFSDADDIADYAKEAVAALCSSGIINGMEDGRFAPNEITSRAQAAVMIYRVVNTLI